jgi:GntR family transcriptional regulator, trigonelline degradation regulator
MTNRPIRQLRLLRVKGPRRVSSAGKIKPTTKFIVRRQDQSLRALTVSNLRRAIFSLHFKPGERLTEKALCELTDVSRALMREALRDLEAQGLIENVPHKSPVVTTLTRSDALEIYEVRSALEPMAAKLFVERANEEQIAALERRFVECRQAMEINDVLAVTEALDNFYSALFAGAGNRTAALLARTLHAKESLLRAITFQQQTTADTIQSISHLKHILTAVRNHDAERAAQACIDQVNRSRRVAMKLINGKPE